MPPNDHDPPAGVLGDDFVELDNFADGVKRHPRTVKRWIREPDGLPYALMGRTILIHIPTAREWLRGRIQQRNPRRSAA